MYIIWTHVYTHITITTIKVIDLSPPKFPCMPLLVFIFCVCVCVEQLLNLMLSAQHLTLTIGTMIYSTYLKLIMCKYNFIPKTHFQRSICHTAVNCPLEAGGE